MDVDCESGMNLSCKELQVLLLHEFHLDRKATKVARNICRAMGKDTLSIHTAQHYFNRLKSRNFKLNDSRHFGRALEMDVDVLKQLIEDPRLITCCLAERLGCSHTTVETHSRELGKTWKYGVWTPYELSPHQLKLKRDTCMALMTSHHNYQRLYNYITGDEVSTTPGSVNGWELDKQVEQRPSFKKDYVKCLVGCKGNYRLEISSKWVQHHC